MENTLTPGMTRALARIRNGDWRSADMSSVKALERRGLVEFRWAPSRPRNGALVIVEVREVK